MISFLTKLYTPFIIKQRKFMNKRNYAYLFCALSLFALSYLQAITKSKDKPMEQGLTLDLKNFKSSPTGILFEIVKPGTGAQVEKGQIATVHYTGHLLDGKDKIGKFFDSSKKRNQPFQFKVGAGQVIKGWDLTLQDMKIGETRIVILPPNMGYGSQNVGGGLIPANSTLIFEIELLKAA